MNRADFTTQPNGFPLESDSTLGFMQSDYQGAIRALAKSIGVQNAILTGVEIANDVATDGWILWEGDIVFFEGGSVADTFVIIETPTAKANLNGAIVDRYFAKKAMFGTGANQGNFAQLNRITDFQELGRVVNMIGNGGDGFGVNWVVLDGLEPQGDGISGGTAIYSNRIMVIPAYSDTVVNESTPVYLTIYGEWTTENLAGRLKFEPRTTRRFETLQRKHQSKTGEIRWIATAQFDSTQFTNGLGKWDYDGWRIADGNFGTIDLSNAITGLTGLQRI